MSKKISLTALVASFILGFAAVSFAEGVQPAADAPAAATPVAPVTPDADKADAKCGCSQGAVSSPSAIATPQSPAH